MDYWKWHAKDTTTFGNYFRKRKPGDTSKEEEWPSHLKHKCAIGSMTELQKNLEHIKQKQPTGYAVDYNYFIGGVKPCWDKDKRNKAAKMDRVIYADINLAFGTPGYRQRLVALLNKWGRLTESFLNGELDSYVQCITIRIRDTSTKLFLWTTNVFFGRKMSSLDKRNKLKALHRIRGQCQQITNGCEQQIKLVWDVYPLAVDYSYSVGGVKPCWDKHKRNAVRMDRIIFADINLASDELDLGALFNKWSRLVESFFNGGLGADVKCITFRPRDISTKIFIWTTKGMSSDALRRIRDTCDDITNRCEQQIRLNWGPKNL